MAQPRLEAAEATKKSWSLQASGERAPSAVLPTSARERTPSA
ncbi:hypothetical protein [Agrococcus sp. Marseille-Q4369]|nr:hypothetical protein [Agrococcus sp. Marseille-Q4369]